MLKRIITRNLNWQYVAISFLALVIYGLLAYKYVVQEGILRTVEAVQLQVTPQPFTELYFLDHTYLPTHIEPGTPISFSFVIKNNEYQPVTYSYQVYATDGLSSMDISSGNITLEHGKKTAIMQTFVLTSDKREQIIVELTNVNQKIHFWVDKDI